MDAEIPIWQKLGSGLKLGLQSCPDDLWLPEADIFGDIQSRQHQIDLKNSLFEMQRDAVFLTSDQAMAASLETCDLITDYAGIYLDPFHPLDLFHPLEAAARHIPEDLVILSPSVTADGAEQWILTAGAVAFPAHWVLADKMGTPMTMIHAPVPGYDSILDTAVNRFLSTMIPVKISCRHNWSLQLGADLFTPHRNRRQSATKMTGIDSIFLRVERQTLRKLPATGDILFTIRTSIQPLARWQSVDGALASLVTELEGMEPALQHYKGVPFCYDAIKAAAHSLP